MTTTLGYDRPLYILPFDHRGTFLAKMLGAKGPPTAEQAAAIAAMKQVIYDGFRAALAGGVPREKAGILVDEQFGADVLRDATAQGYTTALTVEKSGQDEFDFEYGDDFAAHIEAFRPTFAKVLVRYNPEGDRRLERPPDGPPEAAVRLPPRQRPAVHVRAARAARCRRSSTGSAATGRPSTWSSAPA